VPSPPLLAAFDGHSPASVATARVLARLLEVPLVVVTAYHHDVTHAGADAERANERRLQAAEDALRRAAAGAGDDDDAAEYRSVPAGDLAGTLVAMAEELEACAVVVTEDRRGTVTRDVLRDAPCPVVVTPGDPLLVPERIRAVGVGFDGSAPSRLALPAATRIAARAACPLQVIAVGRRRDRGLAGRLAEAVRDVDGAAAEAVLRRGDPETELRAATEAVDVLVCGSHGGGRRLGALLGSVSAGLARGLAVPLVVVPVRCRPDRSRPLGLAHGRAARI
jgi:nucleotide-binding universal stress UspA family protein